MSNRTPTFADVCHAIAEGKIAATVEGSVYQVNALELRRYLNKYRVLSRISSSSRASAQCQPSGCSLPIRHLFA
ncbi:MAG: hypothetical protein J2P37_20640 [Ktedonobacteraceae bacterium]|nr:hypothetical protein [Ktedonobacteraceae bacterium]